MQYMFDMALVWCTTRIWCVPQGKLLMWVDMFPLNKVMPVFAVDIKPRLPQAYVYHYGYLYVFETQIMHAYSSVAAHSLWNSNLLILVYPIIPYFLQSAVFVSDMHQPEMAFSNQYYIVNLYCWKLTTNSRVVDNDLFRTGVLLYVFCLLITLDKLTASSDCILRYIKTTFFLHGFDVIPDCWMDY